MFTATHVFGDERMAKRQTVISTWSCGSALGAYEGNQTQLPATGRPAQAL